MKRWLLLLAIVLMHPASVLAGSSEIKSQDPLEPRLQALAQQLRCPVCQGETIYDSHSTVATQMKSAIREKLVEGKSDAEIIAFFVERYGNFVLMEPDRQGANMIIWFLPGLALVLGSAVAIVLLRRRRSLEATPAVETASSDELIRRIERLQP